MSDDQKPKLLPIEILKRVIVVESRVDMRGVVRGALKAISSEVEVVSLANTQELFDLLAREYASISWVIMQFEDTPRYNPFTLMQQILAQEELKHIKVSITFNQDEMQWMPVLFDLGIVSCHEKPTTLQKLQSDFQDIISSLTKVPQALVAARFLRKSLTGLRKHNELIDVDSRLLRLYPEYSELLVNLLESNYASGYLEAAKKLLQIMKSHPDFQNMESSYKKYAEILNIKVENQISFAELFDYKTVAIVDPDQQYLNMMKIIVSNLGFQSISTYDNAKDAFEVMAQDQPDLIICDWRQRGMSGISFLQKLATAMRQYTPVILFTGQVKTSDMPMLQDLNVTGLIQKPNVQNEVAAQLIQILSDEMNVNNVKAQKRKFYQAIRAQNFKVARELMLELQVQKNKHQQILSLMEAELDYVDGKYDSAKTKAMLSISRGEQNLESTHLLGKIFLKLGDHKSSDQFFSRANAISPVNLERLCLYSEVKAELNDVAGAASMIDAAKKIDVDHFMVKDAEVMLHLKSSELDKAGDIMGKMDSLDRIIGSMNNRAVVLAKKGKFDESLAMYDKTIKSLPKDRSEEKSILLFNKGLALLREGRSDDAEGVLTNVDHPRLAKKVESLLTQVRKAKIQGRNLKFAINRDSQKASSSAFSRPMALYAIPGSLCLHAIYHCELFEHETIKKLFHDAAILNLLKPKEDANRKEPMSSDREEQIKDRTSAAS